MPWYAPAFGQWPHWANAGSALEKSFLSMGWVETDGTIPTPGVPVDPAAARLVKAINGKLADITGGITLAAADVGAVSAVPATPNQLGVFVGGVGDGAADDTTALQAALTAGAGGKVLGRPGKTYLISAPLVISSGTTLDMTGCTIRLKTGSNCNMLRNINAAGPARDNNITLVGGTWDRGANGGTGNDLHSLFLRRIDTVTVKNVTYLSTGGKYGIALGDVTNPSVHNIHSDCNSDTVHVTGPASDVLIEKVYSTGGDDAVGVTTTDFGSYDDVHGPIARITVREVTGTTPTRVVLLGGSASGTADGFNLTDILVENITQLGTGLGVVTGISAWTSEYIDRLTIRKVRGSGIKLVHALHKTVVVDDVEMTNKPVVQVGPDVGQTSNRVQHLTICNSKTSGGGALLTATNPTTVFGTVDIKNCEAATTSPAAAAVYLGCASITRLTLRDVTYDGTVDLVAFDGATTVTHVLMSGLRAQLAATRRVVNIMGTVAVTAVAYSDCYVSAADTNSGDLVYKQISATVGGVSVQGCTLSGTRGVLQNSSPGAVNLQLANVRMAGCNRIAQGSNPLTVTYAGLILSGTLNPPFFVSAGATLTVRGQGWSGYTGSAAQRAGTEVVRVVAPDFPVDLAALAKNNGDTAYNTNAALSCGAGPVVTDGTTWKNTYSGLTY